jgi:hypothetical protein
LSLDLEIKVKPHDNWKSDDFEITKKRKAFISPIGTLGNYVHFCVFITIFRNVHDISYGPRVGLNTILYILKYTNIAVTSFEF